MRICVAISVAVLLSTEAVKGQSQCPCDTADYFGSVSDSALAAAPAARYKLMHVNKQQSQEVERCLGLDPGQLVQFDRAFLAKVCACRPQGLCFDYLGSAPTPIGVPPNPNFPGVVWIGFRKHRP